MEKDGSLSGASVIHMHRDYSNIAAIQPIQSAKDFSCMIQHGATRCFSITHISFNSFLYDFTFFCRASEVFGSLGSMANSKQEVKYTAGNVEISISIRHLGESQRPEVPSSSDGALGGDSQMPEVPSSSGGASAQDPIPPTLNSEDFDVISDTGKPNDFSPEMFVQVDESLGLFRAGGGSCFHMEKCHHLKRRDVKVRKLKVCKCSERSLLGGKLNPSFTWIMMRLDIHLAYVIHTSTGMPDRLQQPSWRTIAFVHALSACEMMVGSFHGSCIEIFWRFHLL